MTIAAAVISKSGNIPQLTLNSLSFVDEILIVVDSSDPHREHDMAIKNIKIKIFPHPLRSDFAGQRNYALSKASSDWIFFVDDDEYVGRELALEIGEAIKNKSINGYYIPRQDVVFHDVLKYGETGKIKILRLAQKNAGKFSRSVHERWNITGKVGDLKSPLYHIKDRFVSEFLGRVNLYGFSDAIELKSENKPFSFFRLLIFPPAKFVQNYFLRLGFLDGLSGLFLAYLLSIQSLSVRVFQWTQRK